MTSLQEEIEKCDLTHRSQQVTRDLLTIRKGPPRTFYTVSNNTMLQTPRLGGSGQPDKAILKTDVLFTELILL